MKFFDGVGGRKNFGFILLVVINFVLAWFGKMSEAGTQTVFLGIFALYVGGNLGDYQINKIKVEEKRK